MPPPDRILRKIEENRETQTEKLNLSGQGLSEIPPELFELTHLTTLILSRNSLKNIQGLEKLTNLIELHLSSNKLSNINSINKLINLTALYLSSNRLNDIEALSNLTNLNTLYLSSNNLTSISALSRLRNLTDLNLNYNNLHDINTLSKLTNLTKLSVKNNPIEEPPIETLKMDFYGQVNIDLFFNYFKQIKEQGSDSLYEAKMLIIGKGGAGKTSLRTKILDPTKPLPTKDESTHGIDIETWFFELENQKKFRVNIWDFGGQAIYHATHRYFLTNNALYVLVIDVRKDSEQSMIDLEIYWWLHAVELWGGKSPVLILQNDTGERLLDIDMGALRKEFESLDNKTYQVNLDKIKNNQHDIFNKILENFKFKLKELPKKTVPARWVEIRQFVEEQQHKNWISIDKFLDICAEKTITNKQGAELLLSAFHELGICLWFQDHDYLRKIVILNPSWATNSAYAVLKSETVKNNKGYFSKEDLKQIWCEDCYIEMRGELLDLMKKFELCYELPQKDHFIAPQLLKNKQPENYSFDPKNALYVYYKYDKFMPKGILHRLMVVLHEKIANNRQSVWLTGALFEKDYAKAQVIEKYADREIEIRVIGNLNDKRNLMSIILEELDKINDSFNRNHQLQVDKLIPCQCEQFKDDPYFFEYKKLCGFANKSRQIQCQKIECDEMLKAQDLLDGISSNKKESKMKRTKAFISYSHKDIEILNQLKVFLKSLETRGILECWDDSKIEVGKKWKKEIKTALDEAKIAILLVSEDFLASDFINKNELPPLLDAAEQDQATILSVIIRPCNFNPSPLSEYQTVNPPDQPLSGMNQHDREKLFVKLAEIIEKKLSQG